MDGLRVTEETGVSYSSIVPGMMHACGHDMHTTALMATTQMMVESRQHWRGTFIALFQPAEETLSGARDMIKDGLYDLIPEPSAILAAHITPEPAGTLSLTPNIAFSRSDRFEIRIHGRGGHASRPESCIDPIVCSAYCITRIQSIVSRVVPSTSAGVITIGKIHGGETGNVIPDFVDMEVSIRSNSDGLAELMERELRRIVASEVVAAQEVDDANPRIWHTLHGPLLCNDDVLLRLIAPVFTQMFGARFDANVPPVSGSEDIAYLTRAKDGRVIPLLYWRYGGSSLEVIWEVGGDPARLPSNHSSKFLPQLRMEEKEDPLKVGARALFAAALVLLRKM
ncbi:putative metal-dependent amidase/aminoacylase/carboxypeptidase [Dendryphion nanum]|uniref:Metal-dependent amidase/aminoacylase/carboxypeptidase n=1 Tax=Dendryphion nanum TaxID=256645 RepID=A0A9P9DBM4_9PLEO|nr:putative metal-dependent amidase/aminoacylase/carboxypeptidase [Dendryphion nanum]